jgi:hypothetical protein
MGVSDDPFINTPTHLGQIDHHQWDNYVNSNESNNVLYQYMFCIKHILYW